MGKILEIKRTTKEGIITEYHAKVKVVKAGTGAGITLPKELLGKVVEVYYRRKKK